MFMGTYTGLHDAVSVGDFGIDNVTAADGLAVGRPSGFVGKAMQRLLDGFYTVSDEAMFRLVAAFYDAEGYGIEPSSATGFAGPQHVLADADYRARSRLTDEALARATHWPGSPVGPWFPTKKCAGTWSGGGRCDNSHGAFGSRLGSPPACEPYRGRLAFEHAVNDAREAQACVGPGLGVEFTGAYRHEIAQH